MKNIFKKYMPDPHTITGNRWIAKLGPRIKDPNLWHLNRRSVSAGIFAGVLTAFIPLPVQIPAALLLCFFIRGNLPAAIGFTWISNPFTYIPLYFFCYELGTWILGVPMDALGNPIKINFHLITSDFEAFLTQLRSLGWQAIAPLFVGCSLVGFSSAIISFVAIRVIWRFHIYNAWKHRKEKRAKAQAKH